jgi:spore maturation protein CgeB
MLQRIKQVGRRLLGRRLSDALKAAIKQRPTPVAPLPKPAPPTPKRCAAHASTQPTPTAPPAHPPQRLLFLSDCYAQDVVWGPFHQSMLAYCGFAFDRVLAIRTNAFFHAWSHRPLSERHLRHVQGEIAAFAPDLVFSINRAGLNEQALAGIHPAAQAITVFVDYYDRIDDSMHQYGSRDLIWGTGNRTIRTEYLRKYSGRLRPEQTIHTLWGVDHSLFYPGDKERDTDIIFVGTPFNPEGFVHLISLLASDAQNLQIFLDTYEAHRDNFIFDWPEALRARGFDFSRLGPNATLFENFHLQKSVCDQISIENRINHLAALAGMNVRIFGDSNRQWIHDFSIANGHMLKHFQFRSVTDPDELVRLYCASKIGVNIQHDHARHHGLSFRVFDLLACQTLLLTHADTKQALDELGFVEDRDYVCFHDPATLRKKCEFYLNHEDQRRDVARSGYERVRSAHTLAHRFAEVFARFGYRDQASRYESLARTAVRAPLNGDRTLKERVTTLHALPAD